MEWAQGGKESDRMGSLAGISALGILGGGGGHHMASSGKQPPSSLSPLALEG